MLYLHLEGILRHGSYRRTRLIALSVAAWDFAPYAMLCAFHSEETTATRSKDLQSR